MTSLEHESNDTSASASDYGVDNWDQENWGEMDVCVDIFFNYKKCFHYLYINILFRHLKILVVL